MPRGLPDYYNPDTVVMQRMVDLHALLTGIIGIYPIDGAGFMIYADNFNNTLSGWNILTAGDAAAPAVETGRAQIPPSSIVLDAGTVGGLGTNQIRRYFPALETGRVGFQIGFCFGADDIALSIVVYYQEDGTLYQGRLRIDNDGTIIIRESDGGYAVFGSLSSKMGDGYWHNVKLVIDLENDRYHKLIIGDTEWSLVAYDLYGSAVADDDYLAFIIEVNGKDNNDPKAYIGHALLTVDEP